jgi:Prophage CP4-57 regulatory protein (AlpA)
MAACVFLRLPKVIAKTGKGRSSIYLDVSQGKFPRPISIGASIPGSKSNRSHTREQRHTRGQRESDEFSLSCLSLSAINSALLCRPSNRCYMRHFAPAVDVSRTEASHAYTEHMPMRRMVPVAKVFFHGYRCSDCGWIRSASIETILDRSTRTNAKVAFNAHHCSQHPLSPHMAYLKAATSGFSGPSRLL